MLKMFPKNNLSIIILFHPKVGFSDGKVAYENKFSEYGQIIFLKLYGSLGNFFKPGAGLILTEDHLIQAQPAKPVPFFSFENEHSVTISCGPNYYLQAIHLINQWNPFNPVFKGQILVYANGQFYNQKGTVPLNQNQTNILKKAHRVFDLFYQQRIVPKFLPYYKPNDLFKTIFPNT